MSMFAALLLATAPTAAPAAPADEIVVIGERLKAWRGKFGTKKGVASCRTTKSTGDKEIDAIGCSALSACIAPHVAQMQAIADMKLPKAERNRRLTDAMQPVGACVVEKRSDAIAELAARRAGT